MKRWHDDLSATRRHWGRHHGRHVMENLTGAVGPARVGRDPRDVECACDNQLGRFRKRSSGGCGRPQCQLCHSEKFPKRERTRQELLAGLRLREGIRETLEN